MLTVKTVGHRAPQSDQTVSLCIYQADMVEHIVYADTGNTAVRLMRYVTSEGVSENNETLLLLDADGVYGPAAVYVENGHGKTIQRFSAEQAVKPPRTK